MNNLLVIKLTSQILKHQLKKLLAFNIYDYFNASSHLTPQQWHNIQTIPLAKYFKARLNSMTQQVGQKPEHTI